MEYKSDYDGMDNNNQACINNEDIGKYNEQDIQLLNSLEHMKLQKDIYEQLELLFLNKNSHKVLHIKSDDQLLLQKHREDYDEGYDADYDDGVDDDDDDHNLHYYHSGQSYAKGCDVVYYEECDEDYDLGNDEDYESVNDGGYELVNDDDHDDHDQYQNRDDAFFLENYYDDLTFLNYYKSVIKLIDLKF